MKNIKEYMAEKLAKEIIDEFGKDFALQVAGQINLNMKSVADCVHTTICGNVNTSTRTDVVDKRPTTLGIAPTSWCASDVDYCTTASAH